MRASEPDLKPTPIRADGPPVVRTASAMDEQDTGQSSLLFLGISMLRHRWRIVRWMVVVGGLATILALLKPTLYSATASFIPQGSDASRSNLNTLAGQLGVTLPTGGQTLSPDFYVKLLKSREILKAIVSDTMTVPEDGNRHVLLATLLGAHGSSQASRTDDAIRILAARISATASRTTSVVDFAVETKWPSVSVRIANELLQGLNDFNQRLRQEQASAERKFVEGRLALAVQELRAAEQRMEDFSSGNRNLGGSASLSLQRERLERDIGLKQQVFTNLTAAYEDVRVREVRDTPVITVIEEPSTPANPEPTGKLWTVILGLLLGAFIGGVSAVSSDSILRRRVAGDAYADEFAGTLGELKGQMLGGVKRLGQKMKR
jgi:uncharacterized protein involved in exopolysaccharide biosynthesis